RILYHDECSILEDNRSISYHNGDRVYRTTYISTFYEHTIILLICISLWKTNSSDNIPSV
ncbi:MAG: hypothetical protein WCF23_10560, partial [Candidatus Nitrosopolaris sp.]